MSKLDKIWISKNIKISTKARLVRALVRVPCGSWTMKMKEKRRVLVMEIDVVLEKDVVDTVPWTARVTIIKKYAYVSE